jgi:DNA replication protein DnaC
MRYKEATIDNLDKSILEAVDNAIKNKKSLFFYGNTGTGKTYALHALSKSRGKVDNFVTLLVEFRDYMQKGFYFTKIRDYINEDYLFIDDIGSETVSNFVLEFLYMVINGRYENMKRTVLSTNLTIEAFQERYGDRITSRLMEMCEIIEIKGDDKRI